jgi:hypothetical protein
MLLDVEERLVLLNLLPAEGDIITLRVLRDLRNTLGLSEDELAVLHFENVGGSLRWSTEGAEQIGEVEVKLGAVAKSIIVAALDRLNQDKKLRREHLSLCDKFEIGS